MISKLKRKIKNVLFLLKRNVSHLKIGINVNHEWYGKDYSGFYICPDLLDQNSIVYSFGIGEDISFDKAIIERHNSAVYGFDPTPKSIDWIKNQVLPDAFSFYPFGISDKTGTVEFYLPVIEENVSGSAVKHTNVTGKRMVEVLMKSLEDIITELGHKEIDVLKMDIEGSEYQIIESICNISIPVNQILIEFHDRFFKEGSDKSKNALKILNDNGYEIFGVSDSYEEVSLIRKKAIQ